MKTKLLIVNFFITSIVIAQTFSSSPIPSPFGINSNPGNGVYSPFFIDIDNDGDQDLLMGRSYSGDNATRTLELYENIGTANNPNFANPIIVINGAVSSPNTTPPINNWVFVPAFADLDNDGDFDLIVGRGEYNSTPNIEYYENTGTPTVYNFTTPPTLQTQPNALSLSFTDFDNDGDLDAFAGEIPDYTNSNVGVQYHENIGNSSSPNFSNLGNISNVTGNGAAYISMGDLNLDGYIDIALSENSNNLLFFTSDNLSNFTFTGILVVGVEANQKPALVDIDNDGDLDLFIGAETGITFYENTNTTASNEDYNLINNIKIFPNPTKGILNINIDNAKNYSIFNNLGEKVQTNNLLNNKIFLSNINEGIYFLKVITNNNKTYTSKFIYKK